MTCNENPKRPVEGAPLFSPDIEIRLDLAVFEEPNTNELVI